MAEDYLKRYRKQQTGQVALGAGKGALQGAGTGAQLGTMILPGIGTAIGAVGGAIAGGIAGGAGASRKLTPYERANLERLTELERRMELGQLGLTEEERSAIFGAAEDRERRAREQARADRARLTESLATGAGLAAAQAAQAEEFAIEEMRKTGQKVAELDLQRAQEQEKEYYDRLAAASLKEAEEREAQAARAQPASLKEAEEREAQAARAQQLYSDFNELLISEITTSGPGGGLPSGAERQEAAIAELAKQFGTDNKTMLEAARTLQSNPGLFDLLITAGG
jgi:hypothetical protein